jgi:hypothetical protein
MTILGWFRKGDKTQVLNDLGSSCTADMCEDCALHRCIHWSALDKLERLDPEAYKYHFSVLSRLKAKGEPLTPPGFINSRPPQAEAIPDQKTGCIM